MNKIEAIKLERDGLEVKEMIAHYAKTGWESIPEDDVQRLKWYGVFLRNPTPGLLHDPRPYSRRQDRLDPASSPG